MTFSLPSSFAFLASSIAAAMAWLVSGAQMVPSVPAQTMAVLRFSGTTRESAVDAKKRDLMRALEAASDWRATGPVRAYFYDPPWTLPFLRRNEIMIPVEPEDLGQD